MSNRLLVSTRKGLFTIDRGPGGWRVGRVSFLAENVTLAHADPRDGGWYAALNLGHFGVKLKFSPDGGETWEERASPAYPEGATVATGDGKPPAPATLKLIANIIVGDRFAPNPYQDQRDERQGEDSKEAGSGYPPGAVPAAAVMYDHLLDQHTMLG